MPRTVKIFLSSTFRDMNAERDVIIKNVLPRLREKAEEVGVIIQEVDLRWGVTEEQVKRGEVENLCLEGIEDCRPYFLCILGARYGWIPCPGEIRVSDWIELFDGEKLSSSEKKLLLSAYHKTNDEQRIYILDQNSPNETKEQLQKILERAGLPGAEKSITHKEIDYAVSDDSCPRFIMDLDKRIAVLPDEKQLLPEEETLLHSYYIRSSGESIWRLLPGLTSKERSELIPVLKKAGLIVRMHSFFFFRKDDVPGFYDDRTGKSQKLYVEQIESSVEKLRELKKALQKSDKPVYWKEYSCLWNLKNAGKENKQLYPIEELDQFAEEVFSSLWTHIQSNPEFIEKQIERSELEKEQDPHLKFIDSRTYCFYGRKEMLAKIDQAVEKALTGKLKAVGKKTQTVMVTGGPGSGKSALLSKFYLDYTKKHPDQVVIPWFVGASFVSVRPVSFLRHACGIIIREFNIKDKSKTDDFETIERDPEIPTELNKLSVFFTNLLKKTNRPVVIIFDALNQIQQPGNALEFRWLPEILSKNICLVLSIIDDPQKKSDYSEKDAATLNSLRNHRLRPFEIPVSKMTMEERQEMVASYLSLFNKSLTPDLMKILIKKDEAYNPLYLHVALEELRLFSRHEALADFIRHRIPGKAVEVFTFLLERIELELGRLFGASEKKNLFAKFMMFLTAGRNGMSEEDLRMLLGNWEVLKEYPEPEIPSKTGYTGWLKKINMLCRDVKLSDYHWNELKRSIRNYLVLRDDEYDFFHSQLKQAAGERYCATAETKKQCRQTIAEYLEVRGYEHFTTVRDLPYYLFNLIGDNTANTKVWGWLTGILCNVFFIEARAKTRLLDELQSDYERALDTIPVLKDLKCLDEFYSIFMMEKHHIKNNPELAFQQIYNELQWKSSRIKNKIEEERKSYLHRGRSFLHQFRRPKKIQTRLLATFSGHEDCVDICAFSPDGRRIASGGDDGMLRIWDAATGTELISTLVHKNSRGYNARIEACAFSSDGKQIIANGWDVLKLLDVETGRELAVFKGHRGFIRSCNFSPDGKYLVTGGSDHAVKLWDVKSRKVLMKLIGHKSEINSCSFSPDGKRIVSCSGNHDDNSDNTVRIWDTFNWKEIRALKSQNHGIEACAFSPDGKRIISGGGWAELKLWDAETGEEINTFLGHEGSITCCVYSSDGKRIVTASTDKTLRLWDAETGKSLCTFSGHSDYVTCCAISPDDKRIVSASEDFTVKLWELEKVKQVTKLTAHRKWVTSCAFSPDGKKVISSSGDDKSLKLWDAETGSCISTLARFSEGLNICTFSPDGRLIAVDGPGSSIKLLDAKTGNEKINLTGHTKYSKYIKCIKFSPDGMYLVSGSNGTSMKIWDIRKRKEILPFDDDPDEYSIGIKSCDFSPDGNTIIFTNGHDIKLLNINKSKVIRKFAGHTASVNCCAFSPDGKKIASASRDETLRIWDTKSAKTLAILSPDSKEVKSLKGKLRRLSEFDENIEACVFSSDGKYLVSISNDASLKLWDAENGRELTTFYAETGLKSCAISPDNTAIVSGDRFGNLYFLKLIGFD